MVNTKRAEQHHNDIKLVPLYQQLTAKLLTILMTVLLLLSLVSVLFYQYYVQRNAQVELQLNALTQTVTQDKTLQKIDQLVDDILQPSNVTHLVSLQSELIALDRQLLYLNDNHGVFQQWLAENIQAQAIVLRIQDNDSNNQQLKQRSIEQLQLVLLSSQALLDIQWLKQDTLAKQLQSNQKTNRVSYSRASGYAKSLQLSHHLQQVNVLVANVLKGFVALDRHTSLAMFAQLRIQVESVLTKHHQSLSRLSNNGLTDVKQQITAFENIVITEQNALEKWQDYLQLSHDYQTALKTQQQTLKTLLLKPAQLVQAENSSLIAVFLNKHNIALSVHDIVTILVFSISVALSLFLFLLWQLRIHIKHSVRQSVDSIISVIKIPNQSVQTNVLETQEIINLVRNIERSQHTDAQFQVLSTQYETCKQLSEHQAQALAKLTKHHDNRQKILAAQRSAQWREERQRYQLLARAIVSLIQRQSRVGHQKNIGIARANESLTGPLMALYQHIMQYQLALDMKSDPTPLQLNELDLLNEIHAILFNKQSEQADNNNLLLFRCDDNVQHKMKVDCTLFEHLISLFVDIALSDSCSSQLLFTLQLQDKKATPPSVNFAITVYDKALDELPTLITQLLDEQSDTLNSSPLSDAFKVFFAKQQGHNLKAQLVDDGFKISFNLPLTMASTSKVSRNTHNISTIKTDENLSLANQHVLLLSNNAVLAALIENFVFSAHGKFEQLVRIDRIKNRLTEKYLNRHQLDVLVIASDVTTLHFDLIIQHLDNLPQKIRPKLMVLQSNELTYERIGFYSQAQYICCKDSFLSYMVSLIKSDRLTNQLVPCDAFVSHQTKAAGFPLLLAVHSPQTHHNLQRMLRYLGFQVTIIANELTQLKLWKTGVYNILITEFPQSAFVDMTAKPLSDIGVMTLTNVMPDVVKNSEFSHWRIGQIDPTAENMLTALLTTLAPWLTAQIGANPVLEFVHQTPILISTGQDFDEVVITEAAQLNLENNLQAAFDFNRYLDHQGSVELALFMLDEYVRDNKQQLDALIGSIKAKEIEKAQLSLAALTLNADILSAGELQLLCTKWEKMLSGSDIPSDLAIINALVKSTRQALSQIDEYAETL